MSLDTFSLTHLLAALVLLLGAVTAHAQTLTLEAEDGTFFLEGGASEAVQVQTENASIAGTPSGSFIYQREGSFRITADGLDDGAYEVTLRYASPTWASGEVRYDRVEVNGARYGTSSNCSDSEGPALAFPVVSAWTDLPITTDDSGPVQVTDGTFELEVSRCYGYHYVDYVQLTPVDTPVRRFEAENGTFFLEGDATEGVDVRVFDGSVSGPASGGSFIYTQEGSFRIAASGLDDGAYEVTLRYAAPRENPDGSGVRYDRVRVNGQRLGSAAECSDAGGPGFAIPEVSVWTDLPVTTEASGPIQITGGTFELEVSPCFGYNFFDYVKLTQVDNPLPVELAGFEAVADGDAVRLAWQTAGETHNAGFGVEVGAEGRGFEEVAFVSGAGTTAEARRYAHVVRDLAPGRYAFRLRQVDHDGTVVYSPEVEAAVRADAPFVVSAVRPNPVRREAAFAVSVAATQHVRVQVYDALGRHVKTLFDGTLQAQRAVPLTFAAEDLPAGLYLLRAAGERFMQTQRVTVVR